MRKVRGFDIIASMKCKVEGCTSTSKRIVSGYCLMHYTRLRTKGDLGPAQRVNDLREPCIVEGCSDLGGPTGACRRHWHKVNNPLKSRKRNLKSKGLTLEEYVTLLVKQHGKCDICGVLEKDSKKRFAVDHDHSCCSGQVTCGKCIRGLLCQRCNMVLGLVEDNRNVLKAMIKYLT